MISPFVKLMQKWTQTQDTQRQATKLATKGRQRTIPRQKTKNKPDNHKE